MKHLAAITAHDSYPDYINFSLDQETNDVTIYMRANGNTQNITLTYHQFKKLVKELDAHV